MSDKNMNKDKSDKEVKQEHTQAGTVKESSKETKTKSTVKSTIEKNTPVTSSDKTPPKKQDSSIPAPKNVAGKMSLLISVLLIVILVLAIYWVWPMVQQEQKNIATAQNDLSQFQHQFSQILNEKSEQINQQQQQINELLGVLENARRTQEIVAQRLDAQAAQLTMLSGASRDAWIVEEVRYLLRLANQRRLMGGDANGVMGLLESADTLLKELDAPDLFSVREAIANNIVALKIAPKVDREGVYLQLLAVQQHIESLPAAPLTLLKNKVEESHSEDVSLSLWQKMWRSVTSVFSNLDQYIRVTHHNESVITVLSEEQTIAQRQQLQLIFEQAKIALLKEDVGIYKESLESARRLLLMYFQHFPENQSLIDNIQLLKNQKISISLPDISSSLERLDTYLLQKSIIDIDPPINNDEAVKPAEDKEALPSPKEELSSPKETTI